MQSTAAADAAGGAFHAQRAPSARAPRTRCDRPASVLPMAARGAGSGALGAPQGGEENTPPVAAAAGPAKPKPRRGRRRNPRPLFYAERVMQDKQEPKKKYLATQRIRRDMERAQAESLALDVNFLKQEIVNLETVRSILQANRLAGKVTSVCNLMAVVHEYFGKIQYGFGRETPASTVSLADKIDFLRAVFDENVDFGTGHGRDAFIAQCQGYTLFHAFFLYEAPVLTQVSPKDEDHSIIIVARNRLRVRVSRQTIAVMFPHIMQDEVMVQALIGSELVYPCEITVYFDQRGRVVRHDADVDFVSGLTAALSSLHEVSCVMSSARLQGSLIVYDKARDCSPPMVASSSGQRFYGDEEKRPAQPQREPAPVLSPPLSEDGVVYSSPSPTHVHGVKPGSNGSSEYEDLSCEQMHASPPNTAAALSKGTVPSRMSIEGMLS